MDNDKLKKLDDLEAIPGVINKIANLTPLKIEDADLTKINSYTLTDVTADDVFVFKATICDNEQDDRNFMPFDLKAVQDLEKLYPGKTMLKDHSRRADNQIARVYDTELVQDPEKLTELGEPHTELIAKIYMIKTEANKDLISEICGGIKKEVSTSASPEKMICNICGTDNMKDYCRHYPGFNYNTPTDEGKNLLKTCKMLLHGATEAYELSFVAVPAQPRASTSKATGFIKPVPEPEPEETEDKNEIEKPTKKDAELLALRLKTIGSFLFVNSEEE